VDERERMIFSVYIASAVLANQKERSIRRRRFFGTKSLEVKYATLVVDVKY